MKPNVDKIEQLINSSFDGNKAAFAKTIGVERSQVSMLLNHGEGVGAKFYGGLFAYCDQHHLNFKDFIFLPNHVKNLNESNPA